MTIAPSDASTVATNKADRLVVFLDIHREMRATALWQESSRERTASMIVAANTVLLCVVVSTGFALPSVMISILVLLLALRGKKFALKYYYLQERDYTRARALRIEIDELLGDGTTLGQIFSNQAEALLREEFQASPLKKELLKINRVGVHSDWFKIHGFFVLMACIALVLSVALSYFGVTANEGLEEALEFLKGHFMGGNFTTPASDNVGL